MDIILGLLLILLMIYRITNRDKKKEFSDKYKDSEIYIMEVVGCGYTEAKTIRQVLSQNTIPVKIHIEKEDRYRYFFYNEASLHGVFVLNDRFEVVKLIYNDIVMVDAINED